MESKTHTHTHTHIYIYNKNTWQGQRGLKILVIVLSPIHTWRQYIVVIENSFLLIGKFIVILFLVLRPIHTLDSTIHHYF
jgi:hypothetical protein